MIRKNKFSIGAIYHVFNKSIANYGIFKDVNNGKRFIETADYYNNFLNLVSFSDYLNRNKKYDYENLLFPKENSFAKYICFNIMPDHYHFVVKVLSKDFWWYISKIENSYSRYFNLKFKRKGPLWQSNFKAVRVKTNEQLLHLSRYVHLNPTTSGLVERPEDWILSSYKDFVENEKILKEIVTEISISETKTYKKFVEDQKDYQKKLKMIKKLLLE